MGPTTPIPQGDRFRLCPFRSPLLRASRLISLPAGTEMFQFPAFASPLPVMTDLTVRRVAPFGHLGITACVPLPRAYRSLPRPSSPLCAQASPTCFRSLDPFFVKQSTRDLLCTSETIHCLAMRIVSLVRSKSDGPALQLDHAFVPRSHNHPLSISKPDAGAPGV